MGEEASSDGKLLGEDPETGLPVTLRTGRFGPYVQLGDVEEDKKPKRSSVPKDYDPQTVDLKLALELLSLPRIIGNHPETDKPIKANFGRYGPYIEHDGSYANLESGPDVFTVGINRAVTLLAEKKSAGPRQRASVLKELGEHADLTGPVQVMSGRYGPYVKNGKINATLPKSADPETITLEEAVALVKAKAEKGGAKKTRARAKPKAKTTKTKAKSATKSTAKAKSKTGKAAPRKTKSAKSKTAASSSESAS